MTALLTPAESPPVTADLAVERCSGTWEATPTAERVATGATTLAVREFGSAGPPKLVEVSP